MRDGLSGWRRFDPRRNLGVAVGSAVFAVVMLAALAAAYLAAGEAERHSRDDAQQLLSQFAQQVRHALVMSMDTRRSIVQATAAQIVASADRGDPALQRHLDGLQAQFPEFAWIGVTDDGGRVVTATGGVLQGQMATQRPWFQQGRERPYLGDVHPAVLLEKLLPPTPDGQTQRVIDVAAPLTHAGGPSFGVLGAQLSWNWIERLLHELRGQLETHRQVDLLLADGDGKVLAGPAQWIGQPMPNAQVLAGDGAFVVGRTASGGDNDNGLGWKVVIRQDAALALTAAQTTRHQVFLTVLLAGLVSALLAMLMTRLMLRRLDALAEQAQGVRRGARTGLLVPAGDDEVSRIGAALTELVSHLQHEKQALQTLNIELDSRVAERTARIEQLAGDARYAAVTRERLRLARDLHDTLAHSLMALLTQIRLIRKLRNRLPEDQLESELATAEDVAACGLTEARAAITQMRHNGVREVGLGPALQELMARFQSRSGVMATLQADPRCAGLADERAETVFRIVEEALNNVERHAQARTVELRFDWQDVPRSGAGVPGASARVRLEIVDDGAGFDVTVRAAGHYGLPGMREQAALIDARLELSSHAGQGTRIVLEFDA
ncbi:MAG: histidine kinase [Burkholderiaceae bacterium]